MIEVKVHRIVEYPPFRARSMKIRIGSRILYTPERMLTKGEIETKRKIPTYIPINNFIILIDIPLNLTKVVEMDKSINTHIERIINTLESLYGDLYWIHYLIPYLVPIGKKYKEKILSSVDKFYDKYLNTLLYVLLQRAEYKFKTVFIPPLLLERRKYSEIIKRIDNLFDKYNTQIIPIIDIARKDFPELILDLIDNEINVIGLKYRPPRKHFREYTFLSSDSIMNKDVLFVMIDSKTYEDFRIVRDFAVMHYLPFNNIDILASHIYKGGFPDPTKPYNYNFRLLDRSSLRLPLIHELANEKIKKLLDELEINLDNKIILPIIERLIDHNKLNYWKENLEDRRKKALLEKNGKRKLRYIYEEYRSVYSLTRLQEVKASTNEFQYKREFLKKEDLEGYLNKRRQLVKIIQVIKNL